MYQSLQLLYSRWRRLIRWEFWPMWLFYPPIVAYIVYLTIRYRGLTFMSVNPGMKMSGFIGERKADSLQQLSGVHVVRLELLAHAKSVETKYDLAQLFMQQNELDFPIVLKPDAGQRGQDVAIIRDDQQIRDYLERATHDTVIQEYAAGDEFGVFYYRMPNQAQGKIFSITHKTFPVVIGDGVKSLQQLIFDNPRTHYMAHFLLDLHQDTLDTVLAKGEEFQVVEIGSHCRGSVFLEGSDCITESLEQAIDLVSKQIKGFYFGRYDIRVQDRASLMSGQAFKVLEVNGVTSESTNIYDPSYSVFDAYKIMFRQWRLAFEIGKQNIELGETKISIKQFFNYLMSLKQS